MNLMEDFLNQLKSYYESFVVFLPKLLFGLITAFVIMFLIRLVRKKLIKFLIRKTDDPLLISFIDNIIYITNIVIGFLILLYAVGFGGIASSILGAAGISAFVIGFAFKDIGENFLAGVVMAFNRPFKKGDVIQTLGIEGTILEMSLRDTHIKTFDGKDVYIPNGQIVKNPLFNYTIDGFLRGSFIVGVEYNADVEEVRKVILNVLHQVPGILTEEKLPRTHVKSLGSSTIDIEVHYWIDTFDKNHSGLEIKSIAQTKVVEALQNRNVGMPGQVIEVISHKEQ